VTTGVDQEHNPFPFATHENRDVPKTRPKCCASPCKKVNPSILKVISALVSTRLTYQYRALAKYLRNFIFTHAFRFDGWIFDYKLLPEKSDVKVESFSKIWQIALKPDFSKAAIPPLVKRHKCD